MKIYLKYDYLLYILILLIKLIDVVDKKPYIFIILEYLDTDLYNFLYKSKIKVTKEII